MLSSGMQRYHLEPMFSSRTTCYHLGWNVIIWDAMLSSVANAIIWDKMLSSGANVIMVSSGANVIIWCYHVMLASGMIAPPVLIFLENFTHSGERTLSSSSLFPLSFIVSLFSLLSISLSLFVIFSERKTARPRSQFLHSYICERFIYSHNSPDILYECRN